MGNRSLETYRQHQERSRSKSKSSPKEASSTSRASPRSSHREAGAAGRRQSGSSSRAAQDGGSDGAVQVAALDERNLKRAVNRYGTMPKGARIGAYLESLRQSGMTPEPVTDQGVDSDATLDSSSQGGDTLESNGRPPHAHPHFQHSSLNKSKQPVSAAAAAQMLRSNSSHGGFGGGGGGRGSPIQRATPNNQLRRALTSGIDTPMRGATATGAHHQLPSEDFLPPPPQQGEGLGHFPAPPSHFLANRRPSPSPRTKRKDSANKENNLPERLKSGRTRASDEEGSDPDRASLQSPAAVQAASAAAASASPYPPPTASNSHLATPKSPTSPISECRTLGSPAVGSLSSPGSTMDDGRMAGGRKNSSGSGPTDAIRPFSKAKLEQKLVDELKAKETSSGGGAGGGAHMKQRSCDSAAPPPESGPASLLVCELAESIKSKGQRPKSPLLEKQARSCDGDEVKKHEVDFKANLRKVRKPDSEDATNAKSDSSPNPHEIDFKSNLKKTPKAAAASKTLSGKSQEKAGNVGDSARASEEPNIVDFKAKLKKPKPMVPAEVANSGQQQQQPQQGEDQLNFKAQLRKVSGDKPGFTVMEGAGKEAGSKNGVSHAKESPESEEDKRKSTGSISSLRKMWESSKTAPPDSNPTSPTSETNSESRSVKFEKRVWPPVPSTETEKPMVPVKPTMKPAAPTSKPPPPTSKPPPPTTKPPAAKPHPLCNIYAAPTTQARPRPPGSKPAIASKPPQSAAAASATRSGSAGEASGDSGGGSSTATEKDSILSSSQTLETKLAAAKEAKSSSPLSTSSLMQLSDSVGSFHSSCASFADNVTPTGRFRFRSLLSKLEEQTQNLRSGAHCIDDIHCTVKDLVTVIQR